MHKRHFLWLLLVCFALGPPLIAQDSGSGPFVLNAANQCAQTSAQGRATVVMYVSGTFSATLQPEVAIQGQAASNTQVTPSTSTTAQSTITAVGNYRADVAGQDLFQLCVSSYVSGSATVYFKITGNISTGLLGSAASGGSVQSVTGTANQIDSTGGNTPVLSLDPSLILPPATTATTQIQGDSSAAPASDLFVQTAIAGIVQNPSYSGNQLISGGGVEWTGGLGFTVGAASYTIAGVSYSSALTNETLATADPSNPRLDVIGVDSTGSVFVLTGTPAATPAVPTVDPTSQLALTIILVPAGSSTASVTKVDIYHENTEWTTAKSGTPINLASTNHPYDGTVDIEATAATTGNYAQATKPAAGTVDMANYNNLVFYLRSKATWPGTRAIQVQWFSGATAKGTPILIRTSGTFGFVSSQNTSYQQISIPTSLFQISGTLVTTVRFTVVGTGATIGWYLDDITLQGGQNGGNTGTFMNWRGTWNATAGYNPNDVVSLNSAAWVCLVANTNSSPAVGNANWQQAGQSTTLTNGTTATTQSALDNSTKVSTTAYTDTAVSNGIAAVNPAVAVLAASTASLTGTYAQVGGGVGDTFTITATGAFTLDGIAINTIGQRVLFKNQSTASQNGVYTATVVGSIGVSPVFTRALDYDTPSDVNNTGIVPVQSGTVNATTSWLLTSQVTSIGSAGSALTYAQFSFAPATIATQSGVQNQAYTYAAGGGTANAQTVTLSPAVGSLVAGQYACWLPSNANASTTPTLAVNGLTAKTIVKANGAALAASDLITTQIACVIYDGTNYELQNPATGGGGGGASNTPYAVPVAASPIIPYGGLSLWLSADCITISSATSCATPSNGSTVSTWDDRSGNYLHFLGGSGCTFNTSQINSHPAVNMSGCTLTAFAQVPARVEITVFAVFKNTGSGGGLFAWGTTNNSIYYWTGKSSKEQGNDNAGSSQVSTGTAALDTSWHQSNFTCIAGAYPSYRLNEATDATTGTTTPCSLVQTNTTMEVGNNPQSAESLTGAIAEILVYSRILNSTEIASVESYLLSRYGI